MKTKLTKSKNLLLLPSSLAIYLMIIPTVNELINDFIDNRKVDPKEVVNLLFLVATTALQQTLRYNENDEEPLFTPKFLPGADS